MNLSATIGAAVLSILVISGCATTEHIYSANGQCLTCWNNPITGKPINHNDDLSSEQKLQATQVTSVNSTENGTTPETPVEYEIAFTVPVNVDIAFLKIKNEFNYFSEQEIRQEWGSLAESKMQTFAYAYDATPSVYYHMRADRNHDGIQAIIDSQIEKQSDKESKITITYWLRDKSVNASQFGESLKNRTRKALNI